MTTCPRCGALNPPNNKFCGECGNSLVAAVAASTAKTDVAELPPWLHSSAEASTESRPSSTNVEQPATDSELPAWLAEIGVDDAPINSKADAPDWLTQLQQASPSTAATDDLPAWLQQSDEPLPTSSTSTVPTELPDWLRDLEGEGETPQPEPVSASPADDLPPWLTPNTGPEQVAALADMGKGEELPAWLQDLETADARANPTPPATDQPASIPSANNDLPDWLSEIGVEDGAPPAAPHSQTTSELPAWLLEDQFDHSSSITPDSTTTPVYSEETPAAQNGSANELPPWLLEDASQLDEPTIHAADTSEFPSWLQTEHVAETASHDVSLPVPDWGSEFGETPPPAPAIDQVDQLPSWLAEVQDPAVAQASDSQVTPQEGELPAWLLDEPAPGMTPEDSSRTASADSFSAIQPSPNQDLPPWLMAKDSQVEAVDTTQNVVPDWLTDEKDFTSRPADTTTSDSFATQELPTWLMEEPASDHEISGGPTATTRPSAQDELPPWLQSPDEASTLPPPDATTAWLTGVDSPTSDVSTPVAHGSPTEFPSWLTTDESTSSPEDASHIGLVGGAVDASGTSMSSEQLPDSSGVRIYDVPKAQAESAVHTAAPPTDVQHPAITPPTDAELPAWLAGIADEAPPAKPSTTSSLPAWLEEPAKPTAAPTPPETGQSELLGGLDLPAWLRTDNERQPIATPVAEPTPSWLQHMASDNEEAIATDTAVEAVVGPRIVRTPERLAAMQLLEQLIVEPAAEPMPQPVVQRQPWLRNLLLALTALLIIGVIVIVLLFPRFPLNFGAVPVPAIPTAAQVLATVPANRPVMLAYEWNGQRLGDLRPLEEAVVGQLAARTDVPLILLSTDPYGALLAQERATMLAALNDNFHNNYGLGYVNLGFKAGGPVALRRIASNEQLGSVFAQDFAGNDLSTNDVVMQSMCGAATATSCSWERMGLLVVIADEVDDVRTWFEQVRSEHPQLPTLLLTSAEIAPQVQPYAATPNVHLLAGAADAEAFLSSQGVVSERLGRQLDATALGGLAWSLLVLVGAVPAILTGRRQRREMEERSWER